MQLSPPISARKLVLGVFLGVLLILLIRSVVNLAKNPVTNATVSYREQQSRPKLTPAQKAEKKAYADKLAKCLRNPECKKYYELVGSGGCRTHDALGEPGLLSGKRQTECKAADEYLIKALHQE